MLCSLSRICGDSTTETSWSRFASSVRVDRRWGPQIWCDRRIYCYTMCNHCASIMCWWFGWWWRSWCTSYYDGLCHSVQHYVNLLKGDIRVWNLFVLFLNLESCNWWIMVSYSQMSIVNIFLIFFRVIWPTTWQPSWICTYILSNC